MLRSQERAELGQQGVEKRNYGNGSPNNQWFEGKKTRDRRNWGGV